MSSFLHRLLQQRSIGVLGAISNQATGEFYRLLNERLNAIHGGRDIGEIIIVSVNFGNIEHFVRQGLWTEARSSLAEKLDRLELAGADVIVCVSNTMHQVVAPLMAERATKFIHIADPTGDATRAAGITHVAVLGTMSMMRSEELADRYLKGFGVEIMSPSESDQTIIDRVIFNELSVAIYDQIPRSSSFV